MVHVTWLFWRFYVLMRYYDNTLLRVLKN